MKGNSWLLDQWIFFSLGLCILCGSACSKNVLKNETGSSNFEKLLVENTVYLPNSCKQNISEISTRWADGSMTMKRYFEAFHHTLADTNCLWSRIKLVNTQNTNQLRVLYFPKKWPHLDCYTLQPNGSFQQQTIGTDYNREVIYVSIPAKDSTIMYIKRLGIGQVHVFRLRAVEMPEETYLNRSKRLIYKFLFLGVLLFPILFFGFQTAFVEREKLNLYYLIFLIGAGLNLITILDTIYLFEFAPRILPSYNLVTLSFVISIFMTLFGLIKYIYTLLDTPKYFPLQVKVGNILLIILGITTLTPILFSSLFKPGNYDKYLQVFRLSILPVVLYIFWICIWSLIKKIRFSKILSLAFAPFFISTLWYTISFILLDNYSQNNSASLILISGFMVSLFLFGIILGVKNNIIKQENIILEQKTERFKELNAFKSRFYTNFTHEFRTPLTVINGIASQIKGHEEQTSLIKRNGERLLQLINQLLDLAKLENNSLEINWTQGDVINYLQYLIESYHSLAYEKKITLAFFSTEEQLEMDFDPDKLQHIVINLLSNAIKFTPEYGSVKVIATKKVKQNMSFLQLSVKDTGMGISEKELPKIFDRFYQTENHTVSYVGGSGIGLSLAKELVELMEGHIEVKSELDKGSEFKVFLPIHKNAPEKYTIQHSNPPITSNTPIQILSQSSDSKDQILVLLIEDNIDVTAYILSCLADRFQVETARNGKKGVDKALEIIPDIIICDVMMPEMDGFEVCKKLKSDRRTSHIPIILLTAKATREDRIIGLSQGADAYLTKPFDEHELLVRINNLTALRKRIQEYLNSGLMNYDAISENVQEEEIQFLKELHQAIEKHLSDESFNTNHLCRLMTMSRTQLHRKIKALTGQPTASFIKTHRLEKAKSLIEETKHSIGEIALKVGFKDVAHFSRSFSQKFGYSPSKSRR